MTLVVDASAIAAIVFAEPESPQVLARLAGEDLIAPQLLGYELANICATKMRRSPAEVARLLAQLATFSRLDIELVPVDHDAAAALAAVTGLTAYDASYLWLARTFNAELVTLDRRLAPAQPPRTPG